MERPYEYLRRIARYLPQQDNRKLISLADQLENLGRTTPVETVPDDVKRALSEHGLMLSADDKLCIVEPWDRIKNNG